MTTLSLTEDQRDDVYATVRSYTKVCEDYLPGYTRRDHVYYAFRRIRNLLGMFPNWSLDSALKEIRCEANRIQDASEGGM